ncbi:MAG: IPT/TIG domain-containing protein, partial [Myxococcota bacterium]
MKKIFLFSTMLFLGMSLFFPVQGSARRRRRRRRYFSFSSMKPSSGSWGTRINIFGNHFRKGKVKVSLNGKNVPIVKVYRKKIIAKIPKGAKTGWIIVTQGKRSLRSPRRFKVKNITKVLRVFPLKAPQKSWINIKGRFFRPRTRFFLGYINLKTKYINSRH